jgi:hypothetical protein
VTTESYFRRHFASASAVECRTSGEGDWRPFVRWVLKVLVGRIFSMIVNIDGGDGRWTVVPGRKKDSVGVGNEITVPKNAMFANHFDDRRGSKVSAAAVQ